MKDIYLIYLFLHNQVERKYGFNKIIPKKDLFQLLGRTYHIPKKYRCLVLKEMETLKLFKKLDKINYVILKVNIDLEDTSKIYKDFGMY